MDITLNEFLDGISKHPFFQWLLGAHVNPYQLLVDLVLVIFAVFILYQKPIKPAKPLSKHV
jgi:hypothetical protein